MSERVNAIQKQVSDMLAVEKHCLQAIERQRDEDVVKQDVEANKVIIEAERILRSHVVALEALTDEYGSNTQAAVKQAVTETLGWFAGQYDKLRDHKVTRMLRDDYTAISHLAMSYTTMHTFGLAVNENRIADLALAHLKHLTPLLVEISKVLPLVTAREVEHEHGFPVDAAAGAQARSNTQAAWASEYVESASV